MILFALLYMHFSLKKLVMILPFTWLEMFLFDQENGEANRYCVAKPSRVKQN